MKTHRRDGRKGFGFKVIAAALGELAGTHMEHPSLVQIVPLRYLKR